MDNKERERKKTGLKTQRGSLKGRRVQLVSDTAASQLWAVSVSRRVSVSDQILLWLSKRLTALPHRLAPPPPWPHHAVLPLVPLGAADLP